MIYKVSTTGTQSSVILYDMGERTLTHPTVELDLGLEYTDDEILDSENLADAISDGHLELIEQSGYPVTAIQAETIASGVVASSIEQGIIPTDFIELADTPSSYTAGRYARTTASGINFESEYIRNLVYVHAEYDGDFSDGSAAHPFKHIYEAVTFIVSNYSPTDSVATYMYPGVYELNYPADVTYPAIKAIIGSDAGSVIMKPAANLLTVPFSTITQSLAIKNVTIDARDIPEFTTTSGTVAVKICNTDGATIEIDNCKVYGYNIGFTCTSGSNSFFRNVEVYDPYIGVEVINTSVLDADRLRVKDASYKHVCAQDGSTVHIAASELYSTTTLSGTAIYSEGEDSLIQIDAGTHIWSCKQNINVEDGAEVRVDNCIIDPSDHSPGIRQVGTGRVTIVNSRAPLSEDELSIDNSAYCYINAYDSSEGTTTIGKGNVSDQKIIAVETGQIQRPYLFFDADHEGRQAFAVIQPNDGVGAEFYSNSNNAESVVSAHVEGDSAFSYTASMGLHSTQLGEEVAWDIVKSTGSSPDLEIKFSSSVHPEKVPLTFHTNGDIALVSGVSVHKILDEDNFASDDPKALVTQQSTRAYITNSTYSQTALNNGQLDNRYYTETEIDNWRDDHPFVASGISYFNSSWDVSDVKSALDSIMTYSENVMGSGRISPETVISGVGGTDLYINAGEGYISHSNLHKHISWPDTVIDVGGISQGLYYVYVDSNGDIIYTTTHPNRKYVVLLGYFYMPAENEIATTQNCGCIIENFYNRVVDYMYTLGMFLTTDAGKVLTKSGEPLKLISSACAVQYGTSVINLTESDIDVGPSEFRCIYSTVDVPWKYNFYAEASVGYNKTVPTDVWNDTTASGYYQLSGTYTFTQYSDTVTCSGSTSDLDVGDYIWFTNEDPFITPVTEINGSTITLNSVYNGPGGTGVAYADKSLKQVPEGKWIKHMLFRDLAGLMFLIVSQSYYDTEDAALEAPMPSIPANSEADIIKMAYVVCSGTETDLSSSLVDIRPLPFPYQDTGGSGGASTGGGVATDHGNLQGLGDDDHIQYTLVNGSRDFTSKVSYASHPTFSTDEEIVDKKYVDDAVAAVDVDHGDLDGLLDDDHPQYHNDARGDARYYTQEQVDTISGTIISQVLAAADLAVVQVRRTTDLALTTSWQDVVFNTLDVETADDVVEWDDSNLDRITIKEDGVYEIFYAFPARSSGATRNVYARILKNDTTELNGSYTIQNLYPDETHSQVRQFNVELEANDFVTLQIQAASTPVNTIGNHFLSVVKRDGVKGPAGPQGDAGIVTISGSAYFDAYDNSGGTTLTTSWQDVPFDTVRKNSGSFVINSNTELVIPSTNTYHITTRVTTNITSGVNRSDCKIRLVLDTGSGYTEIPGTIAYTYNRLSGLGTDTANVSILDDFSIGDKIKVQVAQESGTDTIQLLADGSSLSVHIPGGMPGADGEAGADGVPGSGSTITVKDEGSVVSGSPHSVLDFVGSGVSVSSTTSGTATVEIDASSGVTIQDEGSTVTGGPHDTINFIGDNVTASDAGSGVVEVDIAEPTFGTWYAWGGDNSTTSTNSTSYVQKARLSVTGIPAGYYRLGWYYEWRSNTRSYDFEARVQVDDTDTVMEHNEETKDTNSWHTEAGFVIIELTSGNHYFDMDYSSENSSYTSYMRRARLEFWRVS